MVKKLKIVEENIKENVNIPNQNSHNLDNDDDNVDSYDDDLNFIQKIETWAIEYLSKLKRIIVGSYSGKIYILSNILKRLIGIFQFIYVILF